MKKLIAFLLCIAVAFAISSCSDAEQNNRETTSEAINETTSETIVVTESQTAEKTSVSDKSEVINITEVEAKDIAYKALKEEYSAENINENGIDYTVFEYRDITLYNQSDDVSFNNYIEAVKESGHSYYDVVYRNTNELCDIAYYFVDAYNGDVLFSGYMGD